MYPIPYCLPECVHNLPYPFMSVRSAVCWCYLFYCCFGLGRQAQCIYGVGRGRGFDMSGDLPARIYEQVNTSAILPLRALDADLVLQHHGPPDAPVCGPHQSDGDPNIDVSAHHGVGLTPLYCEAAGYPFQGSRIHHTQYRINGGDECRKCRHFWRHASRHMFFFSRSAF